MRKAVVALAALAVALSLGLVLVGAFLPREHRAVSEVVISRPPDEVWAVLRDFARTPQWWPDVERSSRATDAALERWQQVVNGFTVEFDVVAEEPRTRLVTRVVAPEGAPFGGQWIYELSPGEPGTRVRVTEDGWIGPWPFRSVALAFGHHRSIESCLVSLGRHFGQAVTPTRVEEASVATP